MRTVPVIGGRVTHIGEALAQGAFLIRPRDRPQTGEGHD